MAEPKKNTAFTFHVPFFLAGALVATPTLAVGDIKVSTDESAFTNIGTLPTADAGGAPVVLTTGEMNGDRIQIQFIDQTSPKAWDDFMVVINTTTATQADISAQLPAALTAGGRIKSSVEAWRDTQPNTLISGRVDANAQVVGVDALDAAALKTDAGTEIAAAVVDLPISGHTTSGTVGEKINGASAPSAATVAAAVVDLPISGHTTAGTVGEKINSAGAAGDPWGTALPGAYSEGTAGKWLGKVPQGSKQGQFPDGTAPIP